MNISERDWQKLSARLPPGAATIGPSVAEALAKAERLAEADKVAPLDKPKRKQAGRARTATEQRYCDFLDRMKAAGIVEWWREHPLVITLAPKTTYKPDYLVALRAGPLVLVEVKGVHVWEDGTVKYKIARELRPEYLWICVRWLKGRWVLKFKNGTEPLEILP